jgi:hypothetical protein
MSENAAPAPPGGRTYLRVVAVAAAIGIPAALLAALFLALIHQLEHWLWDALPEALGASAPPWYLVVGLPVVGAGIVLAARTLLPGDGGRTPLEGLSAAPMPLWFGPGIALAAIGTLAFGAVLGPEVTVIALGSLVGVAVTRFARVPAGQHPFTLVDGSVCCVALGKVERVGPARREATDAWRLQGPDRFRECGPRVHRDVGSELQHRPALATWRC